MRLLFIHGWAANAKVWRQQAVLSPDFKIETVDLPGHGAPERWDHTDFSPGIRKVGAVLSDGEPTIGIGWSLGAMVSLAVATKGARGLMGVVAVGATPSFVRREGFSFGKPRALIEKMKAALEKSPDEALDRFHRLIFSKAEEKDPGYGHWLSELRLAPGEFVREDLENVLEALIHEDLREILPSVRIPVLVVHGTADPVCPHEAGRFLNDALPSARMVSMEGAGHAPFLTQSEVFNRMIRDFAREIGER